MRASELITVNKHLNPKIWDQGELKPEIADKLKQIAEAFLDFVGVELDVKDLTVTGSNANYTWTAYSDLDLHIIVPGIPTEQERELYTAKKNLWSEQHDIKIRNMPVEVYIQGEDEQHHSTGVYSIAKQDWLTVPKKTKPKIDDRAVSAKYQEIAWGIGEALDSNNLEKLQRVKDKVTQMRKSGLSRAGEWSVENLVFKQLRNVGLIDKMSDRIRRLQDQDLSLSQE
jgi:hypothetical protein